MVPRGDRTTDTRIFSMTENRNLIIVHVSEVTVQILFKTILTKRGYYLSSGTVNLVITMATYCKYLLANYLEP